MRNIYKFLFHPPSYGRCASNFKKIVFHAQPRSAWEDVCIFSVRGKPVQLRDFKKIYSSRTAKKKKEGKGRESYFESIVDPTLSARASVSLIMTTRKRKEKKKK